MLKWNPDLILSVNVDDVPAGTMVKFLALVDENNVWNEDGVYSDVEFEDGSTMVVPNKNLKPI